MTASEFIEFIHRGECLCCGELREDDAKDDFCDQCQAELDRQEQQQLIN